MHVNRPDELFARIARDKLIGFGEAYLTGAWDEGPNAPDGALGDFLTVLAPRSRRWCRDPFSDCGR